MSKPDLDIKIEEIKKLVTTTDYKSIDQGIDLSREINDKAIFETLLEGTRVYVDEERSYKREDGSTCYYHYPLIPGQLFRGRKDNQHFLNYALLNLIGYCPEIANVDSTINKKNIIGLQIQYPSWCKMTKEYNLTTGLKKFPMGICLLTNLKYIDFSECSLKNIPPEIEKLKNLESINLRNNNISLIPDQFGELINLKQVFLDSNKLNILPTTMNKLIHLQDNGGLWISGMLNLIIPETIKHFINTKIDVFYHFQLELIDWGVKKNIIQKTLDVDGTEEFTYQDYLFYSPEDPMLEEDEKYDTKWDRIANGIAVDADCPFSLLIKFIDSGGYYEVNENVNKSTKQIVINHPNLIKGLKPAGFGRYANPDTGVVVAKMQDGKLVAVEKAE